MAASPSIALTPIGVAGPAFESRLEDYRQLHLRALPSGACRPSERSSSASRPCPTRK